MYVDRKRLCSNKTKIHTVAARNLNVVIVDVFIVLLNLSVYSEKKRLIVLFKIQQYDRINGHNFEKFSATRINIKSFDKFNILMKSTDLKKK